MRKIVDLTLLLLFLVAAYLAVGYTQVPQPGGTFPAAVATAYGELYFHPDEGPYPEITVTTAGDFYKWVSGVADLSSCTTVAAGSPNNTVTINSGCGGIYKIHYAVAYTVDKNSRTVHWKVYKNDAAVPNLAMETLSQQASFVVNSNSVGLVQLSPGDVLDLRATSSSDGDVLSVYHADFVVNKVAN